MSKQIVEEEVNIDLVRRGSYIGPYVINDITKLDDNTVRAHVVSRIRKPFSWDEYCEDRIHEAWYKIRHEDGKVVDFALCMPLDSIKSVSGIPLRDGAHCIATCRREDHPNEFAEYKKTIDGAEVA